MGNVMINEFMPPKKFTIDFFGKNKIKQSITFQHSKFLGEGAESSVHEYKASDGKSYAVKYDHSFKQRASDLMRVLREWSKKDQLGYNEFLLFLGFENAINFTIGVLKTKIKNLRIKYNITKSPIDIDLIFKKFHEEKKQKSEVEFDPFKLYKEQQNNPKENIIKKLFPNWLFASIPVDGQELKIEIAPMLGRDLVDSKEMLKKMTFAERVKIAFDFQSDLSRLNKLGYLHRDIKLENVGLLKKQGASIYDFGSVVELPCQGKILYHIDNTLAGTPVYISPEALGGQLCFGNNSYSSVPIILTLFNATNPFFDKDSIQQEDEYYKKVAKEKYSFDGLFENGLKMPRHWSNYKTVHEHEIEKIIIDFLHLMESDDWHQRPVDGMRFFTDLDQIVRRLEKPKLLDDDVNQVKECINRMKLMSKNCYFDGVELNDFLKVHVLQDESMIIENEDKLENLSDPLPKLEEKIVNAFQQRNKLNESKKEDEALKNYAKELAKALYYYHIITTTENEEEREKAKKSLSDLLAPLFKGEKNIFNDLVDFAPEIKSTIDKLKTFIGHPLFETRIKFYKEISNSVINPEIQSEIPLFNEKRLEAEIQGSKFFIASESLEEKDIKPYHIYFKIVDDKVQYMTREAKNENRVDTFEFLPECIFKCSEAEPTENEVHLYLNKEDNNEIWYKTNFNGSIVCASLLDYTKDSKSEIDRLGVLGMLGNDQNLPKKGLEFLNKLKKELKESEQENLLEENEKQGVINVLSKRNHLLDYNNANRIKALIEKNSLDKLPEQNKNDILKYLLKRSHASNDGNLIKPNYGEYITPLIEDIKNYALKESPHNADNKTQLMFQIACLEAYYDFYTTKLTVRLSAKQEEMTVQQKYFVALLSSLAQQIADCYYEIRKENLSDDEKNIINSGKFEKYIFHNQIPAREQFVENEVQIVENEIKKDFEDSASSQESLKQLLKKREKINKEILLIQKKFDQADNQTEKNQFAKQLESKYLEVSKVLLSCLTAKNAVKSLDAKTAAQLSQEYEQAKDKIVKTTTKEAVISAHASALQQLLNTVTTKTKGFFFWKKHNVIDVDVKQFVLTAREFARTTLVSLSKDSTDKYTEMLDVCLIDEFRKMSDSELMKLYRALALPKMQEMMLTLDSVADGNFKKVPYNKALSKMEVNEGDSNNLFRQLLTPLSSINTALALVMDARDLKQEEPKIANISQRLMNKNLNLLKPDVLKIVKNKDTVLPKHISKQQITGETELKNNRKK